MLALTTISCQSGLNTEDELVGNWYYKRAFLTNIPELEMTFIGYSKNGNITFNDDGTGTWDSNIWASFEIDWKLDDNNLNITLTNKSEGPSKDVFGERRFKLTRIDEHKYHMVKDHKESVLEGAELTEQIVLTR